jgi:hypothetical protein
LADVTFRRSGFLLCRAALRAFGVKAPQAVLILGHMRCGSTLLLHILLTNPEFIGCGERNSPYLSLEDLDKLEVASRIALRAPLRHVRYTVDQINHDHLTPDIELLRDERVRCVFLIRDPQPTIQSILNLTQTYYQPWTVARAVDYYSQRLQTLGGYAEQLNDRRKYLALTYDELVHDTARTLKRLEAFLCLKSELSDQYKIQTFTGVRGDPSGKIQNGHIVRDRPPSVEVSGREIEQAVRAYENCTRTLIAP